MRQGLKGCDKVGLGMCPMFECDGERRPPMKSEAILYWLAIAMLMAALILDAQRVVCP